MIYPRRYFFPKYLYLIFTVSFLLAQYALCRLLFYLYNYDLFANISTTELLNIFYGGVRFDLAGIFYLNALFIIACLLPFKFTYASKYQNFWKNFFVIFNAAGLFVNCIDTVYFPYTLKRTTLDFFRIFKHETNLFKVFVQGMWQYWPVTIFFIVLVAGLILFTKKVNIMTSKLSSFKFYLVYSVAFFLSLFLMVSAVRGGFGRYTRPLAINNAGKYVNDFGNMALVLNTPFTLIRNWRQVPFELKSDFNEEQLKNIFTPLKKVQSVKQVKRKNVIIVIVESLSREHSAKLNPDLENGRYKGYTPFLDSLMEHSLTFTNAYANGRKSIDALPAIITGIPALNMHYVISNYSTNHLSGLGHVLKEYGYDLSFFHGAPNGSMGFNAFMNLAGFKKYFGKNEFADNEYYDGTWGIWDEEFLQFMVQKCSTFPEPFCTVAFTLSSHHPFEVPDKYKDRFPEGPKKILKCVGYTDYALKQFFKTAAKMPWFKNTLFVITADHATIPYHDIYNNDVGNYAVPIIFYTPDESLKGFDNRVAQHPDIFPTILDYLGINTSVFSFGSSLLNPSNERLAFYYSRDSYRLIRDNLVIQYADNRVLSLFNYISDPLLQHNLASANLDKQKVMEQKMKAIIQQYNNRMLQNRLTVREVEQKKIYANQNKEQ